MKKHLAIDIGSESGRAVVGYLEDGKLHMDEIYRFKTQFMQFRNRSMRNFYRYHEEIMNAMRAYVQKYGSHLDSIGVDAWGGDFVLMDRKGGLCRLPESYRSNALTEDAEKVVEERFGARKVYDLNGNQKMPTDTLHQLIRLRQSDDPSLDDPRGILFVADAFHYMLGAKPCCEHSLASYCRFYNAQMDSWDLDIMKAFDIPLTITNEIVSAGDEIGQVEPEILRQVGIDAPVPIIAPCSHDTSCAALAVADPNTDWAFISSGTWSLLGIETGGPIINDIAYQYNYSNSTMPLKTNMFKKNITGTWIIQQCVKAWEKYTYNEVVDMSEANADNDWFIDINATEFYAPDDMPLAIVNAIKRDFGVSISSDDVGTISRIVFQSMALKYRYYLEHLLEAANKTISKVYILGGGSKNRQINQFTANATGYPVYTGTFEASSVGNLLLQAYGQKELLSKEDMRNTVIRTFPQKEFLPKDKDSWAKKYQIYLERVAQQNQW